MKKRRHTKPEYLKNKPYYLVKIPWVATTGMPECPCKYNNALHAAVHSMLSAMKMDEMDHVINWMTTARCQLNAALREAKKPGATVPVVGQVYDYPERPSDGVAEAPRLTPMKKQTNNVVPPDPLGRLVRPLRVGDRVSFRNGKRRGYGEIYAETPARRNALGIPIAQQVSVCTGHPRYQKLGMDVDYADMRICRTNV